MTDRADFAVEEAPSIFQNQCNVRDEIDEFLSLKGYSEGKNVRPIGGGIFVATGTGVIQSPLNNPSYMRSRINAFDKAMLAAKRQMVEYIGVEIRNEIISDYTEGVSPSERKQEQADAAQKELGINVKTKELINAELDLMFKERGIDLTNPVPEEVVQEVLTTEMFEVIIKSVASAQIMGMQPWKVFEGSPDGAKGQIGVVAVYSDKLQRMADVLFSGEVSNLPGETPKLPLVEQIPNDERVLLTTFGVQQKIDENGQLVLVSFGQGVPITQSTRSLDAAYDKAKLYAMSYLRSFAGEIVAVESEVYQHEEVKEFENAMEKYENDEYFRDKVRTQADALNISGIQIIHRWQSVHPLTNQPVVGVIIAWWPPQKKEISGSIGGSQTFQLENSEGGSYSAAGGEADEDGF